MEQFVNWLQEELDDRGWSQAELARRSKMTTATISHIFTGERRPGPETCTGIATALKYPPEVVFRKAGLLPEEDPIETDIKIRAYKIARLDDQDREEIDRLIEIKLERPEKRASQTATSRGEPARTALIGE
jgi:transcriptional regulator with XRE-family HTH domain